MRSNTTFQTAVQQSVQDGSHQFGWPQREIRRGQEISTGQWADAVEEDDEDYDYRAPALHTVNTPGPGYTPASQYHRPPRERFSLKDLAGLPKFNGEGRDVDEFLERFEMLATAAWDDPSTHHRALQACLDGHASLAVSAAPTDQVDTYAKLTAFLSREFGPHQGNAELLRRLQQLANDPSSPAESVYWSLRRFGRRYGITDDNVLAYALTLLRTTSPRSRICLPQRAAYIWPETSRRVQRQR